MRTRVNAHDIVSSMPEPAVLDHDLVERARLHEALWSLGVGGGIGSDGGGGGGQQSGGKVDVERREDQRDRAEGERQSSGEAVVGEEQRRRVGERAMAARRRVGSSLAGEALRPTLCLTCGRPACEHGRT